MTTVLIVARARPAMNSDQMNLKSRCDKRKQLWFFHCSPSPQPSPASGRGSKAPGDNTAPRLNSFPRGGKAGIGAAHRLASNAVAPTPTLPQRGRKPTHAARSSGVDPAQAERSDGPYGLSLPSGRAEKHRAWGGHGLRSKPMLRALTRCGCLSGARKREASSAAPPRDRASQVARSEAKGHGQWGALLLPTFLVRARKVGRPPGRTPGRQRPCTAQLSNS